MNKKKIGILIAVLSVVTIFLRLWQLNALFHFTYDEEVFAFVGKRMWVNHHIPLIGGVTPMHVHLAPYFYWLSGLLLGLSKLNPIGWGVAAAILSLFTGLMLFYTGKKMYGVRVGLIAFFLFTFSFSQNIFDRHYWGLSFNGLWAVLTLLSLHQLLLGKTRYVWILAVVVFLAFHFDPSTVVLYLAIGVMLVLSKLKPKIFTLKKPTSPLKIILLLTSFFLLSLVPLVIFDLRHDFANSKGINLYVEELQAKRDPQDRHGVMDVILFIPRVLSRSLVVTTSPELATQYSYCTKYAQGKLEQVPHFMVLLTIGLCVGGIYISWSKRSWLATILLLVAFATTGIGILLYGMAFNGRLYDHYITTLLPPFFILTALVLDTGRNKKWLIMGGGLLFVLLNMQSLLNARHQFGYEDKLHAVRWAIAQTEDQLFSMDVLGDCFRYNGYRYLFYLAGKEPAKSYVDANFTHLYDRQPAIAHPELLVVIINRDQHEDASFWQEYQYLQQKQITHEYFNDIEVMLIDNTTNEFKGKF